MAVPRMCQCGGKPAADCNRGVRCFLAQAQAHHQGMLNAQMQNHSGSLWIAGTIYPSPLAIPLPPVICDPLPSAGMKVEDLIGWRIWRVGDGYLWSYSQNYAWMPGEIAEGKPGDHDTTGIWAFKDKRRAFQKAIGSGGAFVWGSVRLWGSVVEHADGFRAEKARIVSIEGGTVSQEALAGLCERYEVPMPEKPLTTEILTAVAQAVAAAPRGGTREFVLVEKPRKVSPPWPLIYAGLMVCAMVALFLVSQ